MQVTIDDRAVECPQLGSVEAPRLIDSGFIHNEASIAGFSERYGRGESSHTIHVWWARRPHSAMRMLVFASLSKDATLHAKQMMTNIGSDISIGSNDIQTARNFILNQYSETPKFLDMFGGGGTIPFEALNLGAETYSIDANPLSVFIQKCNLEYFQQTSIDNVQGALREIGESALNTLAKRTEDIFPLRASCSNMSREKGAITYLWTYSTKCNSCGYRFFLTKRHWVTKKNFKDLTFVLHDGDDHQSISIEKMAHDSDFKSCWNGRKGTTLCPKCGHENNSIDIRECKDELVCVVRPNSIGRGKVFQYKFDRAIPDDDYLEKRELELLVELNALLPSSTLPKWSGIINPAIYGIETHADFLNKRQRIVLLELILALRIEYEKSKIKYGEDTAKFLIALLSGLIDQSVDWNCRLSMWIPQNEQVGRGFCGPGVSMLWDYAETDPVMTGPSNLLKKLDRIVEGSRSLRHFSSKASVQHAFAQQLPFKDSYFDSIVTDPPYYDNIFYSPLADFIYAWKRLLFIPIEPELFSLQTTENSRELVASKFRAGSASKAHEAYCLEIALAINEACRVLKKDGVFAFIYSHNSINGWEAIVKAYRQSALTITSVQPLSIERKQRPRAMTSEAVNTCIAFVSRKSADAKPVLIYDDFQVLMSKVVGGGFVDELLNSGWNEEDVAMAAFAQGVAVIANNRACERMNDVELLKETARLVSLRFHNFKISSRGSL